jgi:Ni,Fe-hydrogenase III small subunit
MKLPRLLTRPIAQPPPHPSAQLVGDLAARLETSARRRLGRGLALRHIGTGGCDGCALELIATRNLVHELESLGLRFVDSPRHADALLVSGPVTRNMREALEQARAAMPEPGFVVALGDCAVDGGVFKGSYAVEGGVEAVMPPDLRLPGCPPSPRQVLEGLLALVEAQA